LRLAARARRQQLRCATDGGGVEFDDEKKKKRGTDKDGAHRARCPGSARLRQHAGALGRTAVHTSAGATSVFETNGMHRVCATLFRR
jgi:hypothetical protein